MSTINHKRRDTLKGMGLLALSPLYANSLFADEKNKNLMLISNNQKAKDLSLKLPKSSYTLQIDMIEDYQLCLENINKYLSNTHVKSAIGVLSWSDYVLLNEAMKNGSFKFKAKMSHNVINKGQVFKLVNFISNTKKEKHYV